MKDISHSFFRYDSKTTTIILSKTENFIWENQIYIIDYYNNNFSHVHPIKRKEKFIEVGKAYYYSGLFPILKPEENDLFFEIKIKGQSK